jgi:hypothetical protein
MIQRGGGAGFLLEAPQAISIDADLGGQDLDGDVSAEPRVLRTIDFAHPADADGGLNLVRAEANAGTKRHEELRMNRRRLL